ncbi:unnamed protein product [marine sediment metagenome]|uniref:Uncharacterized protein n=1 Tax=marine sediment metagenome TaxID=412755 RepID=X0TEC9_9ZZZZ
MPHSDLNIKLLTPPFEAFKNVPIEGAKRRNIENLNPPMSSRQFDESAENREKRCLRFTSASGRDEKDILSFQNDGHRLYLGVGRADEASLLNNFSDRLI